MLSERVVKFHIDDIEKNGASEKISGVTQRIRIKSRKTSFPQ
jgi:hypothetical protein